VEILASLFKIKSSLGGLLKDIWVPLSGALAQQRNVETIANNLANTNTPGFKRDQLTFREYLTALEKNFNGSGVPSKEFSPGDFYHTFGAEHSLVEVDGSYTDQAPGQIDHTGNSLDFAINGPGFFEILSPTGVRYTKKGTFSLTSDGILANEKGFPVLKAGGEELKDRVIKLARGPLGVNEQGEIFQEGSKIGNMSLVEFKNINALRKEGNSLYINHDAKNIKKEGLVSTIHQGSLESSNVNAMNEMSNLIKASRNFETLQQVIKAYDSMAQKAVNEISKF
jgi:flagellar basal-body rod protein FlgG